MNKFFLIIIFFLVSCSSNNSSNNFNFSDNMSIDEFKLKLQEYAKNSPYQNIND
jgi:hypothetical protein